MFAVLGRNLSIVFSGLLFLSVPAFADERPFTYSYEAEVLPEGQLEVEQWITNQSGKEDGDFTQWDFRTELEYGVTNDLQTALYLNFSDVRSSAVPGEEDSNNFDFKGFSSEWVLQVLNPQLDALGLALYTEFSSDGLDFEWENKVLLSKDIGKFALAANLTYEAEWEREDSRTEREATFEFTAGAAYKINPQWSVGLELRNKSAYPDGLDLKSQEYNTWSVGPNVHYGSPRWWATLTILPQVFGNGDGAENSRQLVHEENLEVRLIVGFLFS